MKKPEGLKFSWFKAELKSLNERRTQGVGACNASIGGSSVDKELIDVILALETRQKRKKGEK